MKFVDRLTNALEAVFIFTCPLIAGVLLFNSSVVGGFGFIVGGFFVSIKVYQTWSRGVDREMS